MPAELEGGMSPIVVSISIFISHFSPYPFREFCGDFENLELCENTIIETAYSSVFLDPLFERDREIEREVEMRESEALDAILGIYSLTDFCKAV
jgi:hypothetical protein